MIERVKERGHPFLAAETDDEISEGLCVYLPSARGL